MPPEPAGPIFCTTLPLSAASTAVAEEGSNAILSILLLILLILLNAFFAASEIAVITLNDNKIRKMAEDGNKKAK